MMKKINHFKMVSIGIIGVILLSVGLGFAQQGSEKKLRINTHGFITDMATADVAAAYDVLVSKQFVDVDDNARFGDPSGQSDLQHLIVNNGLEFDFTDFGSMIMSNGGIYSVDFDDTVGEANLNHFIARKFTMTDSYPDSRNHEGKKVYDIAEGINVESGDVCDVVVISKNNDLSVTRSTVKFDPKVAGVISEAPKIYMGPQDGYKPLALSGIVKCNVNTQNGPIKRGDILVTSSEPGYAMKADENQVLPGMIVGSALDALDQGKGKIQILIN